jgi:hypothetical protein
MKKEISLRLLPRNVWVILAASLLGEDSNSAIEMKKTNFNRCAIHPSGVQFQRH